MDGFENFLWILLVFALFFAYALIRRWVLIRRNRVCPVCGHRTEIQRRSEHKDTREDGPIRWRRGEYILSGHVITYWSVICCPECGYEERL